MTIKEEGMPIFEGHGHGDMYVEFNVVLPTVISEDTRKSTCLISCSGQFTNATPTELEVAFMADKQRVKEEL